MIYWQTDPFTSFTLELNTSGSIYINWKTNTPNRNGIFEIERSTDQQHWTRVQSQPAQLATHFSFLDAQPVKGVNYYRIKLVRESNVRYSTTHKIEIGDEKECFIWPQPASTVLHLRVSFSYGTFEIIDESGRTAQKRSVTGFVTDIPISQLPAGIYFVRIKNHDKIWLKKFVKQ